MPWEIKQNYGGCAGYAVVKEGTTEVEGCHSSRSAAQRQIAALYASEPEAAKVKKMMKPGSFSEGDFAMASVDDHVYVGQIVHIMTEGMLGVEGSKKSIVATPENPAILIRVFEQHEDGYWKETYMFTGFDSMSGSLIDPLPMKRDFFINGGTEKSLPEMSREEQKEFVEQMTTAMDKADSVRVGQMVSWNSSGGRATGKVVRIIRNGKYNVPNSDFTITGTEEDPAAVIRLYRDGEPTDTMVGHKVSTLRSVGKSMENIELIKEIISSWDKEEVIEKSSAIESDSSEKKEVPENLSSIFSDMPTHAKRVNTMGNAPISLNLFRGEERGRRNL